MDPTHLVLLAILGVAAGFINVMAGGGSLLTLPMMVFMGLSGPMANGSNRVAITLQNVAAVAGFFRKGFSDFKLSLSLALCSLPGVIAGAWLGTRFDGPGFNRFLAGVMIAVMVLMATGKKPAVEAGSGAPRNRVLGHLLMIGAGFYGGFIQAGVGFIMMAILHRVMGLDLVRVNMHKVFIVGVFSLVALAVFAGRGQVLWSVGLLLALGNATGAWIASHVAVKGGEKWIRAVLFVALSAMAIKLIWMSLK